MDPPSGQDTGICMGEPDRPISDCSQIPHAAALSLQAATKSGVGASSALHFTVTFDAASSTIDIADAPTIDCNESAQCTWLTAAPDLSVVLVNAAASSSSGAACDIQPDDPKRWGIALLSSDQGWPAKYSSRWTQCSSADNNKQLTSAHLAMNYSRVIATFAHVPPGSMDVDSLEVCAFDVADGVSLWCTPTYATPHGSTLLPVAAAISKDDWLVFHSPFVGVLGVDAAASAAPSIELLFAGSDGSDNCCAATAIAATHGVAVASIPEGSYDPPWCNCMHSQLIGVALPQRS